MLSEINLINENTLPWYLVDLGYTTKINRIIPKYQNKANNILFIINLFEIKYTNIIIRMIVKVLYTTENDGPLTELEPSSNNAAIVWLYIGIIARWCIKNIRKIEKVEL